MRNFFRNKGVLSGIFMIVLYQVIMLSVFMSGYSAVPKNIDRLTVAVVNEDAKYGVEFADKIKEQLPFRVITDQSLAQAKEELENRDIHFIMQIPSDFSEKLSGQGEKASLNYYANGGNPAIVVSTVQSVAEQITNQIAAQLQSQSFQGLLTTMQMPEEQAKATVDSIMTKVESNIVVTNPQPAGMHNQMAPMFLTMATYVGAMIYSMMSVSALKSMRGKMGKWKAFLALQGTNAVIAVIAPLVGLGIYFSVQGYDAAAFFQVWLNHSLELFAAIEFTSIFSLLLGQAGMLLNMVLLLVQTISNGAVMPRAMMPGFFEAVSHISVMYYTVQLDYNFLFGGGKTGVYLFSLAAIALSALAINAVIFLFKKEKAKALDEQVEPASQPIIM
ncbi:YhgE/Pip domain-containing protein [Paenibacillus sp. NPDC058071]|uniref:YhgE/Pip domain-containing protein n=1 Tax=Paenibacillus sp. NPDC058071 TaxID=3346326 RepID=UPI0036D7CB06